MSVNNRCALYTYTQTDRQTGIRAHCTRTHYRSFAKGYRTIQIVDKNANFASARKERISIAIEIGTPNNLNLMCNRCVLFCWYFTERKGRVSQSQHLVFGIAICQLHIKFTRMSHLIHGNMHSCQNGYMFPWIEWLILENFMCSRQISIQNNKCWGWFTRPFLSVYALDQWMFNA